MGSWYWICWGRESWLICFSLVCDWCTVCHGLFALPLGVIGRLWSVIVVLPGHLLYYFCASILFAYFKM